ncbi:hypothetical protein GBW32_07020 [Streptomyces tsukubensis]|nr:hypothetical protein GBW32_07020 [Streptomyces tsukubensis]
MRPAQEPGAVPSVTPIYDELYAEYRRLFRTLPGDRSGEDELGLPTFGSGPHGNGYGMGGYGMGGYSGAYGDRRPGQPSGWGSAYGPPGAGTGTGWSNASGRQHDAGNVRLPAALPPAPRRGL